MGSFSKDNLPITKDGVYVIILDDKQGKVISLFIHQNIDVYFF